MGSPLAAIYPLRFLKSHRYSNHASAGLAVDSVMLVHGILLGEDPSSAVLWHDFALIAYYYHDLGSAVNGHNQEQAMKGGDITKFAVRW